MFSKFPKSDILLKIFVKMTPKIQILLDILHKIALKVHFYQVSIARFTLILVWEASAPPDPRYLRHIIICDLSARSCLRLQDRPRLSAQTKNDFFLNEISHGKLRTFPLVRVHDRVLYIGLFIQNATATAAWQRWSK